MNFKQVNKLSYRWQDLNFLETPNNSKKSLQVIGDIMIAFAGWTDTNKSRHWSLPRIAINQLVTFSWMNCEQVLVLSYRRKEKPNFAKGPQESFTD